MVRGDRELLLAALANLLQNACKFTRANTEVTLNAYVSGEFVLINFAKLYRSRISRAVERTEQRVFFD